MDTDLFLVCGILLVLLSVPSFLSARADRRSPRVALFLIMIASVLLGLALGGSETGYRPQDLPEIFMSVLKRML